MFEKRGQLTVFIILGIVLVGSVLLFFGIKSGFVPNLLGGGSQTSVNAFLNSCLEEEVEETISLVLKQGGYAESKFYTSFRFKDDEIPTNISYLCYNQNDYAPCVVQEVALFNTIEKEIENSLTSNVEDCFDDLVKSLEKQGNDVSSSYNGFDVSLEPGKIVVQTDSKIILTKSGESTTQENFRIIVLTKLYELVNVVQEVINKETFVCDFNHRGYELLYPKINIEKIQIASDSSDIYTIKHEDSNEEFLFAVRGCIIPPGLNR